MDRKISSVIAISTVIVIAGIIGILVLITGNKDFESKNVSVFSAVKKNRSEQSKQTAPTQQIAQIECKNKLFEGEAKIHVWVAPGEVVADETVLNILPEDVSQLPEQVVSKVSEKYALRIVDAPKTLIAKLKNSTQQSPELITIKGLKINCDKVPPVNVSVAPGSLVFSKS